MPHTTYVPVYATPSTLDSGEVLTSAEWSTLVKDVAFMRSGPWAIAYQTANSSSLATNTTQTLFGGTGSGAYTLVTNAVVSAPTVTSGVFTVPQAGMYHISLCVGVPSTNTAHWRAQLAGYASGTNVWNFAGNTVNAVSGGSNDFSVLSITVPLGTGAPMGGANQFAVQVQNTNVSGAAITVLGQPTLAALQTTWVSVSYLGNGFGQY